MIETITEAVIDASLTFLVHSAVFAVVLAAFLLAVFLGNVICKVFNID